MSERVIICIGTKKGLFVAESAKTRRRFELRGPFSPGVAVYSTLIDDRGTPRLFASIGSGSLAMVDCVCTRLSVTEVGCTSVFPLAGIT